MSNFKNFTFNTTVDQFNAILAKERRKNPTNPLFANGLFNDKVRKIKRLNFKSA